MHVTVELTNLARHAVGQKEVSFDLDDHTTYQEILRRLGNTFPQLIGMLIDEDGETLMSGNLIAINGDLATPAFVMHECPKEGDRLILLSIVTGG